MEIKHLFLPGIVLGMFLSAMDSAFAQGNHTVATPDEASLDWALANSSVVNFACDGTIGITNTKVTAHDITLDGTGHNIAISGNLSVGVFVVNPGIHLTLKNLMIANGQCSSSGAGIYSSALDVPVISSGYNATGNVVNLSLGFAPPTGTNLMVVKNTGLGFINGQFSNLAQGQVVDLSYGGKSYRFVANYYGGTGNDLVLQWAFQDLAAWGYNYYGELGNNSTTNSSVPVLVTQSGVLAGKNMVSVAAGGFFSLALSSDSAVAAWGYNNCASISVNGSPITSGLASQAIPLVEGANAITVIVTAPDGLTTKTYTVMITSPTDAKDALGVADANGVQTVTVTIPQGTNTKMFGRLKVMQP